MNTSEILEKQIIDDIQSTNWNNFIGPEYYSPRAIPENLLKLVYLRNEEDKWNVYNDKGSTICFYTQ